MSFFWRFAVVALIAAGIALAVLARRPAAGASAEPPRAVRSVTVWLGVVLASLALVGVVSHTVLRHVIQVTPLVVALLLLVARSKVGVPAAGPLFAFWLLLMIAIWLFLTGIARIVSGTFTTPEIALTIVIAAAGAAGLVAARRRGTTVTMPAQVAVVASFAASQYIAMIGSAMLLAGA